MESEEFIQRFLLLECEGVRNRNPRTLILSSDKVIGIPVPYEEARFMSFGRFKLRKGRKGKVVTFVDGLSFSTYLLYRAMRVLHRRTRFELGLYTMSGGGEVFALREGENVLLVAPTIEDGSDTLPFEEFVVRTNRTLFKKWKIWTRILYGRRTPT